MIREKEKLIHDYSRRDFIINSVLLAGGVSVVLSDERPLSVLSSH